MPFVTQGSCQVLRRGLGPASYLFVPTLAMGVGLLLVGGKNVLQHLDVVGGREALALPVAAVLLGTALVLMAIAALAALGRTEVTIDLARRTVTTEARLLVRLRGRSFGFDDFDRVEILRRAGRRARSRGAAYTFFCPSLRGPRVTLVLDRLSMREAAAQAQTVAQWVGVPVIPARDV